eukprot:TRINITY_DN7109_c0_g1_i1.p1 TRINITY_DN7109_c0_g1~~TRINITY_DN7109_c0_g1_i1.p1  ORF type:complete len:673 (+),score=201.46 TRINITY_DN7109_c0_g1_i1:73-2091(+)
MVGARRAEPYLSAAAEAGQAAALRAQLTAEEAAACEEFLLVNFLRESRWRPAAALPPLRAALKWRSENLPITEKEVACYLGADKFSILDTHTADGMPVICFRFTALQGVRQHVDTMIRAYLYLLEQALHATETRQVVSLVDCAGLMKPPTAFILRLGRIAEMYYPSTCVRCAIWPVPNALRGFFNSVVRFCGVGGRAHTRLHLCNNFEALSAALQIPEELLPGTMKEVVSSLPRSDRASSRGRASPQATAAAAPEDCPSPRCASEAASDDASSSDNENRSELIQFTQLCRRNVPREGAVITPWFPGGIVRRLVTLEDEVNAFAHFAILTPGEEAERQSVRQHVQAVVRRVWPQATVRLSGSAAYGLCVNTAEFDCVVDGCGDLCELGAVSDAASACGMAPARGSLAPGGLAATLDLAVLDQGLTVCVHFESEAKSGGSEELLRRWSPGGDQRRHVAIAKGWLAAYPAARSVTAVLRYLLETARLGGRRGGLSTLALLAMVVHSARRCCDPHNAEQLLWCTLTRLTQVDFSQVVISADTADNVPRCGLPEPVAAAEVVVVDPLAPPAEGGNLAASCTQLRGIVSQLEYVMRALMRWDHNASQAAARRGFRGRTPLSAVISHTPLWPRTRVHYETAYHDGEDERWARPWDLADRRGAREARPPAGLRHPVAACP